MFAEANDLFAFVSQTMKFQTWTKEFTSVAIRSHQKAIGKIRPQEGRYLRRKQHKQLAVMIGVMGPAKATRIHAKRKAHQEKERRRCQRKMK